MGLFGLGSYNKEYAKNTEIYKSRVQELMFEAGNQMGIGKVLNLIMMQLDKPCKGIKPDAKEQKAIDARIDALLDTMTSDLQNQAPAKFSAHTEMLMRAVKDSRNWGKERYNKQELEAQEGMAVCQGEIYDALDKKGALIAKKDALLEKASKETNPAEIAKIKLQYNQAASEEQQQDQIVAMFTARYNNFVGIVNARAVGSKASVLDQTKLTSPKALEAELSKINTVIERNAAEDDEVVTILEEHNSSINSSYANTGSDSAFDTLLENKKNAQANASIDGMSVSGNASESENDPFSQAMKNLK